MGLLRSVTRSLPAIAATLRDRDARARLATDVAVQGLPAARRELLRGVHPAQRRERATDDVDRVRGPERLGEDVPDPRRFDDRAHRAAGDHAGALRGRLEQHRAGAELLADLVGDRGAHERHADEVLLGVLDALPDGLGHLARLAEPGADDAVLVTDDDDRAEAEPPAALDDLGHSIDLDDALLERVLGRV